MELKIAYAYSSPFLSKCRITHRMVRRTAAEIEIGQMELFNELLQGFKDVEETDGTLLNHTMVLYGCHMGDANIHNNNNLPVILAGGGFKHGQNLAFNGDHNTPLANLYVSMLGNMGLEKSKFASSTGTLTGLG